MLPLIIDHRPPYLRPEAAGASLLTLPVGARSLLDSLARLTADLPGRMSRELFVVPSFPYDQCYERRIRSATSDIMRVFPPGELDTVLEECEPADYVLVLDSARWPASGFNLAAALNGHGKYQGATHLIAVGTDTESTREHVAHDGGDRVRRVQRLYDRVTWPEVATTRVFLSLVPASALGGTRFTSLGTLRSALCSKGVFSRDVPVALDAAELPEADGVLILSEAQIS